MPKRLAELMREAIAKSRTEEGRRELAEEHERLDEEARQATQKAARAASETAKTPEKEERPQKAPETPEVRAERRVDPILPVARVREHPAREAGRLIFAGVIEERKSLPAQLPLLPRPEGPRVPILELSDWRGVPTMARGRGAPLDLRLAVGACILVPHAARAARGRLAVTVRELRDFLFPNGWQRGRDWPRVRDALFRARDYVIPGPFLLAGRRVGTWLPFALRGEPGTDASLDDLVLIDVELPPGSGHGPVIDRRELSKLGVHSAPRFRSYIAAHSVSWKPGITRRRHPKNRRRIVWSSDPANYPVLTAKDRDRLAFGEKSTAIGARSRATKDAAWEEVPGAVVLTRNATTPDGRSGWRIVPEEAAAAIRSGRRRRPT